MFDGAGELAIGLDASMLAAIISVAGILAVANGGERTRQNAALFSAFAVGLITVSVFFHLIPSAAILSKFALGWVAAGFTAMVLLGTAVQATFARRPDAAALTFGYASIIALAAHSFLDGSIYATSFHGDRFTGWLATFGLILHEFPEGIIAYSFLAHAGLGRIHAILLSVIAAALTTVAGTVFANLAITMIGGVPLAAMLGGASGALIYVLIFHLAPHATQAIHKRGYDAASLGVLVGTLALIVEKLSH